MRRFLTGLGLLALATAACTAASEPSSSGEESVHASPELPIDLDTKSLVRELRARGVRSKTEALALLPRPFKQRFVLVTNSGGLGLSSRARPRVIHFTEDAKLILATSGHAIDQDSTAHQLEILEHDDQTNAYRTHTIEIDPVTGPELVENDVRCEACHGESGAARPIWGSYPTWPTAYGGSRGPQHPDSMTDDELAEFRSFAAMAKTDPDYRHLELRPTSDGYHLATPYGYPNTLYGEAIGNRHAGDLYARMARSPHYASLEYAIVAEQLRCDLSPAVTDFVDGLYGAQTWPAEYPARRTSTKMFRLLGVEPSTDLHVMNTLADLADPADWEPGWFHWDAGTDYLPDLVTFQAFAHLVAADPTMGALFARTASRIAGVQHLAFHATRSELLALGRDTTPTYGDVMGPSIHWTMLYPVMNPPDDPRAPGEGKQAAVCHYLDVAQQARQRP